MEFNDSVGVQRLRRYDEGNMWEVLLMNPNPRVSIRNINLEHKYGSPEQVCAHNGSDKARKCFLKLRGLHLGLLEDHIIHTTLCIVVY